MKIDKKIYEMLKSEALADKNKALLSLELLGSFCWDWRPFHKRFLG